MCWEGSFGLCKSNRLNAILLLIVFGVIFCVAGGILIYNASIPGNEIEIDYTDCIQESIRKQMCKDYVSKTGKECICYMKIEINQTMKKPVTVFYELESYDQISSHYSLSRDDHQLAGHLSAQPSDSCGSYSYTNSSSGTKPIAPCGELADAMFNDSYTLQTNNAYVSLQRDGLISEDDKKKFKNPPGQNLSEAFKNFEKPINWIKNLWELDSWIPDNNGFQNEAFIIWMNTELKRKPAWRVNHTGIYEDGLPPANYTLRVTYAYPTSRYNGQRKVIISSSQKNDHPAIFGIGIALLIIGPVCFILAVLIKQRILFVSRSVLHINRGVN